jgi:hydrogenase maturation factor
VTTVRKSHFDIDPAPRRGPDEHCITCGDQGVPMRVMRVDERSRLALCHEPAPDASAVDVAHALVDVDLIGHVRVGDILLVHAGTAIARLPSEEAVA